MKKFSMSALAAVATVLAHPFRAKAAPTLTLSAPKHVLLAIAMGLVVILLAIILGLFLTPRALPNWAENVFVSIATTSALKLGDCVNAIVALSTGRSVERLGTQLGNSAPTTDGPLPVMVTNAVSDPVPTTEAK